MFLNGVNVRVYVKTEKQQRKQDPVCMCMLDKWEMCIYANETCSKHEACTERKSKRERDGEREREESLMLSVAGVVMVQMALQQQQL